MTSTGPSGIWFTEVLFLSSIQFQGQFSVLQRFSKSTKTDKSINNVVEARHARGQRTRVALLGFLSFTTAWTLIPTYLFLQPDILHNHLIPFVFFAGLLNAYSVGRIIVAHLTKSSFPRTNILIPPLIFGVADSIGPFLQEQLGWGWPSALGQNSVYQVAFVFMCLGLSIGVYGSFVHDVITTICDYLDIWCLTIKHPYVEGQDEKAEDKKGK